eukprot:gene3598-2539_t
MNREKELWVMGLESFLSTRLTTPAYASALRSHSEISVPALPPNSQGLLDGFLWALNDHPAWARDAWGVVLEHLKRAHERLDERDTKFAETPRDTLAGAEHRKRCYSSRAAIQDVYLSFCVVDALLKSAAVRLQRNLLEDVEVLLPQLVCDFFPTLRRLTSDYMRDAELEYHWLFWDLLRSWISMETISPDAHRRLEFYVRDRLKRPANSLQAMSGSSPGEGGGGGAPLSALLLEASSSNGLAAATAENVDRTIRSFLNYVFPSQRVRSYRHRCQHCGAPFDNDAARDAHYRYHFYSHNLLRSEGEKAVRLQNPTKADFIAHCGDFDRSGYFAKVTAPISQRSTAQASGMVEIRRMPEVPASDTLCVDTFDPTPQHRDKIFNPLSGMQRNTHPAVRSSGDAPRPDGSKGGREEANVWSSQNGGNVLNWLAQKTQPSSTSKGAVEYLTKTSKQLQQLQDQNVRIISSHVDPAAVTAANGSTGSAPSKPTTISQDTLTALQSIIGSETVPVGPPRVHEEVLPAGAVIGATEVSQEEKPAGGEGRPAEHRVRGRKRRDGNAERAKKRQDEAIRRHKEAMKSDPEYKEKFLSTQELHREMEIAQHAFFAKYSAQETMFNPSLVTERLDIPVIMQLIEQHDVVFICTDTGTGKSTNIPKALLEMSPDTRVVSTQPRRTATIAIANRVASIRHENVGEDVGYWIRGEKKGDEQTRLWYMTSYTLLLRILENPSEIPYTHIVLDEFHERQPDLEVMVALLRLALFHHPGKLKVILMSATLNTENWEEYFAGLKVATYKQSEPEHPIHDYFLEGVCTLLGHDYTAPPNLTQRMTVDKAIVEKQMYIAENFILFLNLYTNPEHSILVFLPGRAQVEKMQSAIEGRLRNRVDVVPWHSAVDLGKIEAAMNRGSTNRQKIYLATDIAEVSITLPDVVFVVDLNLVKRPQIRKDVPSTILHPPLLMKWISKGSLAQRRGRVGRVQQGFYFCLFPYEQIGDLQDYSQPPIENSRVDELSLHCLQVVSNPAAIYSICHGQPLLESIISSMNTLTQLGCILDTKDPCAAKEWIPGVCDKNAYWNSLIVASAKKEIEGEIVEFQCTFLGRLLQLIPVSPQQGILVFFGFLTGLESLMILAAAVTSSLSPFTVAGQEGKGKKRMPMARAMEETENVMLDMCCGLRSDVLAAMKATLMFRIEEARHGEGSATVKGWCTQKNLSYDKLTAITDLENHIKYELAEFLPFRDIINPSELLEQLDKMATTVVVMVNAAFVAQAVEVMSEGMTYNTMESAVGIFSDLFAVPDIHSPSCFRWLEGDIIIPIQLSLSYDKLLASFSTAIKTYKQFWASLLLLSYRVHYATFSDDEGTFHVFSVTYGGKKRIVEMDEAGGYAVMEFRRKLSLIGQNLHITHKYKNAEEGDLEDVLATHGIRPLVDLQREVITSLVAFFAELDKYVADEVEHDEDDLDNVSILSFGIQP